MPESLTRILVPESAVSTVVRRVPDSVGIIKTSTVYAEITKIRWFLNDVLGDHDPEYIERACSAIDDPEIISAATWFNDELSGFVLAEEINERVFITDLILRESRQGAGARAKKLLNYVIENTEAKTMVLVSEERDKNFFKELFSNVVPIQYEAEGETSYIFSSKVDNFRLQD